MPAPGLKPNPASIRSAKPSDQQVDIVITCMGRLAHLRRSLPLAAAQTGARCIVVDYSCPDHCGDWVEAHFPLVRVIRVTGQRHFNMSAARNAGASVAKAPWLFFVDADILLAPGFVQGVLLQLRPGFSYHGADFKPSTMGTFVCARQDFERIGGFDEVYEGWGAEDRDLFERLALAGVHRAAFSASKISTIEHGDDERVRYMAIKDTRGSQLVNRCYLTAKMDLLRLGGRYPSLNARRRLYRQVKESVLTAMRSKAPADIQIPLRRDTLHGLESTKSLHYHLDWTHGAPLPGPKERLVPNGCDFPVALKSFHRRWPVTAQPGDSRERPVFLLASGVRSGSTLLQRAMMQHVWVWGEPWGTEGLIEHLMAPFLRVSGNSPRDDMIEGHPCFDKDLGQTWIAKLYPHPARLKSAARAYLSELLAPTAAEQGLDHWGLKEVRLDVGAAAFLRWLYPHARIVFLVRNPYDAYRSYCRQDGIGALGRPPGMRDPPESFGALWCALARGFADDCDALGAHLIRYEDLLEAGSSRDRLQQYLGFELDEDALAKRIVGRAKGPRVDPLSIDSELERLGHTVGVLAERFGYFAPSLGAGSKSAP